MKTTLKGALIALICSISVCAYALADTPTSIDIPAGDLSTALQLLSKRTGIELVFNPQQIAGIRTKGVTGTLTSEQAVRKLLEGTKLELRTDKATGAMMIGTPAVTGTSAPNAADGKGDGHSMGQNIKEGQGEGTRVAQVDQTPPAPSSVGDTSNSARISEKDQSGSLEEIVVTGSHIRGETPIGVELLTITRADIDKSGYARVEDVLAQLPQNLAVNNELGYGVPQATGAGINNNNRGTEVQLRGLGAGTTLTLIDGARQPAGGNVGGQFVDISLIPAAAIDRIEILPDGASAIYGSDAIGGVVNVILRKDFSGAETRLYQSTADGSAPETQFAQLFGTSWSGGHFMIGYEFDRRSDLPASERARSALGGDYTSLGGSNLQEVPFASNPGTILNSAGQAAYKIPTGQNGTHLTVSELIPGGYTADDVSNVWALPRQVLNSAFFNASQKLNDAWEVSFDGFVSKRDTTSLNGGAQDVISVPSTNPFYVNPFGGSGPVHVAYDFTKDLGVREETSTTKTGSGSLQAIGNLGRGWDLTLTGSYGSQNSTYNTFNYIQGSTVRALIADPNPATSLNVFGDGSNISAATLQQLRFHDLQSATSDIGTFSAVADGPLLNLPAGPVRLAVGTDYRNETLHAYDVELETSARNSRHVFAGFVEAAIPIMGPSDGQTSQANRLELSIAERYEHYSDFGNAGDPKIGLTWRPIPSLKLRGTWGKSFRAPPFIFTNTADSPDEYISFVLPDPKSPTGSSNNLVLIGNNPNLSQETAKVWTTGIDFTPTFVPGFKTSLTYYNIDYYHKVGFIVNPYDVLVQPNIYAPFFVARPPTAAQVSAICNSSNFFGNCAGPIASIIDAQPINVAVEHVSGLDFSISESIETGIGIIGGQINGTHTFQTEQQFAPNSPSVYALNTVGFPLAWRAQGGVSWALKGLSANVSANYTGRYDNPGGTPDTVASLTTINVALAYSFPNDSGWLKKTRISFNVIDAFNRQPPFVNQPIGYDGANANLLGRVFSGQIVKGW